MKTDSDKTKEQLLKENDLLRQRISKLEIRENNLKKEEEALIESEKKLREARKMAHLGFWYWDVKTGDVEWSDEIYGIFQLDPERFKPQIDSILALSSKWPEDSQRGNELIRKAVESKEQGSYEQRFLLPDGSTGYYESSFHGIYDAEGELTAINGTVLDITKRKQAEENLQKSNSLLHSIIESPDNIIMFALDKNYNYLSYNKAHANEMKYIYDADIEIGQNIMQYIPTEKDRRKVVENYKRVLKGERFTEIQQYGLDEDRSWYELIFNPIMSDSGNITGFTVFVTNITERKQAEKALLSEKMLAEGYINSLPGLFYVFDEQGLIARWNKEMERVTGYSSGEIGTMHGTDFFEGEDKQLIGERMLEVFTKGSSESEAELVTKDGRRIPYYFTGLRREFNGKPHLVGLGIDITERKKVEDELKKYREKLEALIMARTEELEKQNKKLENAMKVFIDREMKIINLEKRIRDYDKT